MFFPQQQGEGGGVGGGVGRCDQQKWGPWRGSGSFHLAAGGCGMVEVVSETSSLRDVPQPRVMSVER